MTELSESDSVQLHSHGDHDMPLIPAKYTIIETDCANDTCQLQTEIDDHRPVVPLIKTGVIDVISKKDKY